MRSLSLNLTSACDLACTYCYQDRRGRAVMEWETARGALDWLYRSPERELELHLYGGEPLLAFPLFRRVVEHARATVPPGTSLRIDTSTNGILLDDRKLDFLTEHEVGTQVSFDGVPVAQDLRQAGTFRILDDRLHRLRRERPAFFEDRLEIAITLTAAALPVLADSVEYFLGLGIATILATPRLTHDPRWRLGSARELERQLAHVCRVSRQHFRQTGRVPVAFFRKGHGASADPRARERMCGAGTGRSLVVDVDGSVHGCVLFAQSYQSLASEALRRWIAPLRIARLDDPAFDRRLRAFRARVRRMELFRRRDRKYTSYGRCVDCPELARCTVCPVSSAHIPGNTDPRRIADLPCAFTRAIGRHVDHFPAQPGDASGSEGGLRSP